MNQIAFTVSTTQSFTQTEKSAHSAKVTYPNQDIYNGEFIDGKREGEGTYEFASGDSYTGTFENNLFHGKGTYTFGSGTKIIGNFVEGAPLGFVQIDFENYPDWSWFKGRFENGRANGKGELSFNSGDAYKGGFKDGVFDGRGCMFFSNGDCYDGNYTGGRPSGKGKMLFRQAKVIMDRNFQNGVDRANTNELKSSTHDITKKKKPVSVKVKKNTFRPKANGDMNMGIISNVLGGLKFKGKRKKKERKRAKTKRTVTLKAKKVKRRVKKTRTVVKKAVKKRVKRVQDLSYLQVHRSQMCGQTKRKTEKIDLDVFTNSKDVGSLRRTNSMARTIEEAERWLMHLHR